MVKRPMKYNPAFLSDDELIDAFVVRQTEADLVLQVLRENTAESNQHVLLVGPRGIGKTMLVLRVAAEARRADDLRDKWYPLVFAEESYPACTAGEFWLEALFHLAEQTKDARRQDAYEELRQEPDEGRLRERALARLMDFADAQGKRILLVVENLNMLLGDQMSDDDAWALRHTLLHEPRLMLLATATNRFAEVENAGKALYDQFRVYPLRPLEEDDCARIWASVAGKPVPDGRIRPIRILTGGNPRLLAIISRFGAEMSFRQLMTDLVHLVDEHTEYFKSHLDALAPIERKAYVALVELWDPATAREVAEAARLGVSKTSALLNRLADKGAVLAADEGPRKKRYQVAERLYNIYYLMRRRGSPAARVRAVVHFMVNLYGPAELLRVTRGIAEEACGLPADSRRDHYSAFEMILRNPQGRPLRDRLLAAAPEQFLQAPDTPPSLKDLARETAAAAGPADNESRAQAMLQNALALAEDPNRLAEAETLCREALALDPASAAGHALLGLLHERLERYDEAEDAYRKAIEVDPKHAWAWAQLGQLLHEGLKRYDEAEVAYRKAIELDPKDAWAWAHLGQLLHERLERYDEAEQAYRKAIELHPKYASAWASLGKLLHERLERYDEAEQAYRKAIELDPKYAWAWAHLGQLLHERLERYDEAEGAYRKAIELDPKYAWAWAHLGQLLHERLERYDEAEEAYRKAIELDPKYAWAWASLGKLLHERLERYDEAEDAYRKVIEVDPKNAWAWAQLGGLLHERLERYDEAEKAYRKAIELTPKSAGLWLLLGGLLHECLDRYDEAEEAYRKAVELNPKYAGAWAVLGKLLHERLERYDEAEAAYRTAIEHEPQDVRAWSGLIQLLSRKGATPTECIRLVKRQFPDPSMGAMVLNNAAYRLYRRRDPRFLAWAEAWAREAVALVPENLLDQHTLASVLGWAGQGPEALAAAAKFLADVDYVKRETNDAIDLFVTLAAAGFASEALGVLRESPSAEALEPLIVGLRLLLGEDVKVAAEVLEVGKDVAQRIHQRREQLPADRDTEPPPADE